MERQGFQTYVDFIDPETINTYFYKTAPADGPQKEVSAGEELPASADWEVILKQYENKLVEIDVRQLEMPMPMMTILENLEQSGTDLVMLK